MVLTQGCVKQHQNFLFGGAYLSWGRCASSQWGRFPHVPAALSHSQGSFTATSQFLTLITPSIQSGGWLCPLTFIIAGKTQKRSPEGKGLTCSDGNWARVGRAEEAFRLCPVLLRIKRHYLWNGQSFTRQHKQFTFNQPEFRSQDIPTPGNSVCHGIPPTLRLKTSNLGDLCCGLDWVYSWSCTSIHRSLLVWVFLILCLKKCVLPTNLKIVLG